MVMRPCSRALVFVGCGLALLTAGPSFAEKLAPAADSTPAKPPGREDVEKALDTKLSFSFVETPLSEVAAFLEENLKINVQLDQKALEDAGAGADTPITRQLIDVTARSQLDLLLTSLDLTYIVGDGVLIITTPEKAGSTLRTVVYPVDDLIQSTNEFGEPIQDYDWLIDLITGTTFPTTWDVVGGPASISAFDGTLAISQTDEVHRPIATLIAKIRELRDAAADLPLPPFVSLERDHVPNEVIRKKLDQSVSLEFVEAPLSEVAEHLCDLLKINLQLDTKALEDAGAGSDTPITFRCNDLNAATALKLMLAHLDLTYLTKNEVLLITTPEKAGSELVLYLYPARDFVRHATDREAAFESLMTTITTTVQPTTWDEVGGPGAIKAVPVANALLISQTKESQQEIEKLLEQIRASTTHLADDRTRKPTSALETRIYNLGKPVHVRAQSEQDKPTPVPIKSVSTDPPPEEVAQALERLIEPQSWKEGDAFVSVLGDKLIIRQQPTVHRKIKRVLVKIQEPAESASGAGGGFFSPRVK